MSDAWAALRDGARRVNGAPAVLFGAWTLMLAAALQVHYAYPLPGTVAARWVQQMLASPTDTRSALLLRGATRQAMAVASTSLVAWLFITGGILDRYARDRATRPYGFFAASGVFFIRFLRLAAAQLLVYALVLSVVDAPVPASILIALCTVVADYARVRAVVEDRRSMLGAVAAAIGFVRRNVAAALVLFAIEYAIARIGVDGLAVWNVWNGTPMLAASALVAVWMKLWIWASETALFQRRLAHAGYVARPEPWWPESPAAEAIQG